MLASSPSASGIQLKVHGVRGPQLGASPGCDLGGGSGPSAMHTGVGRIRFLADEGRRSPSFLLAASWGGHPRAPAMRPCQRQLTACPRALSRLAGNDSHRAQLILSCRNSPLRSQPHRTKPVSGLTVTSRGERGGGSAGGSQAEAPAQPLWKRPVVAAGDTVAQG